MGLVPGLTFFLVVVEFAKIHDSANRRINVRRYFDQIQPLVFGHLDGVSQGHHAGLFAVCVNDPDFCCVYLFVTSYTLW